ncbi:uncharacterized protein TRAVEDRAFT_18725 [Trametes versicolor FP-101664 SS1]|uniref:uncharacterized protein n=1 Tax=Trametes versicolor (strain FP-101664) TaxID=717944 RepID=UPI0004621F5A|nr:uncharacterized protein TRAVEDRAFT_18725 [Trametes versicolor FP-101664 SS1]EIW62288.1 hypothetical protein TRAVEDRAFT_18725 [Trametes versicolor FP-101664 SS1]
MPPLRPPSPPPLCALHAHCHQELLPPEGLGVGPKGALNINEVAIAVEEHNEWFDIVKGALQIALERLALAEQRLKQLGAGVAIGGDNEGLVVAAPPPKQTVTQKNALQGAVRLCLKVFMEIMDSEALPQPLENGHYWEAMTMSWGKNKTAWLLDDIHRIKRSGYEYSNHDFGITTHDQMKKAMESVWKTLIKKWTAQNPTLKKQAERVELNQKNQHKVMAYL